MAPLSEEKLQDNMFWNDLTTEIPDVKTSRCRPKSIEGNNHG